MSQQDPQLGEVIVTRSEIDGNWCSKGPVVGFVEYNGFGGKVMLPIQHITHQLVAGDNTWHDIQGSFLECEDMASTWARGKNYNGIWEVPPC